MLRRQYSGNGMMDVASLLTGIVMELLGINVCGEHTQSIVSEEPHDTRAVSLIQLILIIRPRIAVEFFVKQLSRKITEQYRLTVSHWCHLAYKTHKWRFGIFREAAGHSRYINKVVRLIDNQFRQYRPILAGMRPYKIQLRSLMEHRLKVRPVIGKILVSAGIVHLAVAFLWIVFYLPIDIPVIPRVHNHTHLIGQHMSLHLFLYIGREEYGQFLRNVDFVDERNKPA